MNTVVMDSAIVRIPDSVIDIVSFRRWMETDEVPEDVRVCYLNGEVWVDMSKEQFFSHNQVKQEYGQVLGPLAKASRLGRYVPDGMLLSNVSANLSSQPDGAFVSNASFESGRVRLIEGAKEGFVELEGSPDMVLEVISDSSVEKDTDTLMDLYWRAKIEEYWLVDARGDELSFMIYRFTDEGYVESLDKSRWIESKVFQRSFQLRRGLDSLDHPEFTLTVQL